MASQTRAATYSHRPAAVAAFLGPALLVSALVYHPFILFLNNDSAVAHELQHDTARWFASHLLVAIAAIIVLLAFVGVRSHVRRTVGHEPWTARAITPLVAGTVLFAMLPAMEIAMLAPNAAGADMVAVQEALNPYFMPILLAGSLLFAVGSFLFAHGIRTAAILPTGSTWIVVAGLVVSALSRFVPMTPSLLVGAGALLVAFSVLGASIWRVDLASRTPVGDPA